ncbi:MAG: hypothetical protein ACLFUJ_07325 [Phycisphaerae bacterium]
MKMVPSALLLLGSPKPVGSTSLSLGNEILDHLHRRGWQKQVIRIGSHIQPHDRLQRLCETVDQADAIILSFGLYVDSPPAVVIRAMEEISAHRATLPEETREPKLLTLVNCGLAEAAHAAAAIPSTRLFANQARLDWIGGMAMGMSGMISGQPLRQIGPMTRHLRYALELAADAIDAGRAVPDEAVALMGRPLIPEWLFQWFGTSKPARKQSPNWWRYQNR